MGEFIRWYFQDGPPYHFAALDEDENPRFDMPWHVATLIGRYKLCPYIFYSFVRA
jgi:hypothetical protein